MAVPASSSNGLNAAAGEALIAAVAAQDRGALAAVFADDVHVRALVPRGLRVVEGPAAAVELIAGWFANATSIDVLAHDVEAVADRLHVGYRLRVREAADERVIEQQGFADVVDGRILRLDLVCSGFRPVDGVVDLEPTEGAPRRFDAGGLGCGDGLPAAFREEMATLRVGDRLEVVVADPAAKADLPSLARLMGHAVETTEDLADGRVRIVVEKGR